MAKTLLPVILENDVVTGSNLEMTFFFFLGPRMLCIRLFMDTVKCVRVDSRELARRGKAKELWGVVYALVPCGHTNQRHQPQTVLVTVERARDEQIPAPPPFF